MNTGIFLLIFFATSENKSSLGNSKKYSFKSAIRRCIRVL